MGRVAQTIPRELTPDPLVGVPAQDRPSKGVLLLRHPRVLKPGFRGFKRDSPTG